MPIFKKFLASLIILMISSTALAEPYKLDASHSQVSFQVKHLGISNVTGRFTSFKGNLEFDPGKIEASSVAAEIDVKSVDTANKKRDVHLLNDDFFQESKFPKITFKSKSVKNVTGKKFQVVGDLTMHGVTKEVTLDSEFIGAVKGPYGKEKAAFTGATTVDRRDFGLTYNKVLETGGFVISNEVKVMLDIQVVKAANVEDKSKEIK